MNTGEQKMFCFFLLLLVTQKLSIRLLGRALGSRDNELRCCQNKTCLGAVGWGWGVEMAGQRGEYEKIQATNNVTPG